MNQATPTDAVITDEELFSRHVARIRLETTQALASMFAGDGERMFRVEQLHLEYIQADRGPWEIQICTVTGSLLKANGAPGKMEGKRRFDGDSRNTLSEDCPAWIAELAERYRPGT